MSLNVEGFFRALFPSLILILGVSGNMLGLIVFSHQSLDSIGPRDMYRYLMLMDTAYLSQIIIGYLERVNNIQITNSSPIACKLVKYFDFALDAPSPMLIFYISVERLISLKYPAKCFILRNRKNQLIYLFIIVTFNFIYYVPMAIDYDLDENKTCTFSSNSTEDILLTLDLINLIIVPFVLTTSSSVCLIYSIFKLRKKIMDNFLQNEHKNYHKDIKLAITSISLNFFYLIFSFPYAILVYIDYGNTDSSWVFFAYFLYFISYSVNFYIILITNTLVRKEFISIFSHYFNSITSLLHNRVHGTR